MDTNVNAAVPKIFGVRVDALRLEEVMDRICSAVDKRQRMLVGNLHVRGANLAYEQAWFREFLNSADIVYCDGMGVKLGASFLGYDLPERFTLADWIWELAGRFEAQGASIYLLGNPPGVPEAAAQKLKERFCQLEIAGAQHGYFDKERGSPDNDRVVAHVNQVQPDVLFVGFGMPAQEKWLMENWPHLNVRVAIACGAIFEYIAGTLPRGPHWMTENYLEWLARLVISPRRYWRRYFRDNPLFIWRVLQQRLHPNSFA